MPMYMKVGDVSKELSNVYIKVGDVSKELSNVYIKVGDVSKEIHSVASIPNKLTWNKQSYGTSITTSNNGFTVTYIMNYSGQTATMGTCGYTTDAIQLSAGTIISAKRTARPNPSATTDMTSVAIFDSSLTIISPNSLYTTSITPAVDLGSFTISTTGTYYLGLFGFGVSAGQGGTSYTGDSATVEITIS